MLICEFQSGAIPATWSVWPVSRALGWLNMIEGRLEDVDYTIVLEEDASDAAGTPGAAIILPDR
jgi:hypothetical protein